MFRSALFSKLTMGLVFLSLFLVFPTVSTEKKYKKSGCFQRFKEKYCRKGEDQQKLLPQGIEAIDDDLENRLIEERIEEDKRSDFLHAVKWGDVDTVKYLATQNVDLNSQNGQGETPVWIASWKGHLEIVKFLATQDVDLDQAECHGISPIEIAAFSGFSEIVEFLATTGKVNLNHQDNNGQTPFFAAVWRGYTETFFQVKSLDYWNHTPLWATSWESNTKIVEFLIKQNVDLNKADCHGISPLFVAATQGYTEIVELLVASLWDTEAAEKVDLNQRDEEGRTPILMATRGNHIEIIKMLIESGSDLEENLLSNAETEETKQIIAAQYY